MPSAVVDGDDDLAEEAAIAGDELDMGTEGAFELFWSTEEACVAMEGLFSLLSSSKHIMELLSSLFMLLESSS